MFAEAEKSNAVVKLQGILKNRYGLGLKIASITDARDVEVGESKGEVRGDALYVTICARGKYLATAVVSATGVAAGALSKQDLRNITDLVRLVLEPVFYSEVVRNTEENSAAHSQAQIEQTENVIPLYSAPVPQSEWMHEGPEFFASILLLESTNAQTIQRVGIHVHELGERWALLNFRDVCAQVKTLQDLRELGSMTLVVDDASSLTSDQQKLLAEFAANSNTKAEPLVLIGSTLPLSVLEKSGKFNPELALHMRRGHLQLDRLPTAFGRLQEALELFLDRKAMLI